MSNLLLGWPIYSDVGVTYTPVLSGGSWLAALPLGNLQNRRLHHVARSSDDALTSTIIKADLGVARAVRLVALPKHNLSTAAEWRVRGMGAVPAYEGSDTWVDAGGTPGKTTGQADPLGGTRAVLLEDNDGAAIEQVKQTLSGLSGDAEKVFAITMKAGTAAQTGIHHRDATAGTNRHVVRVTWTGGVPSLTTESGSGDLYTPIAVGDGFYLIQFSADGVIAGNTNELHVRPAGSTASATGTVTVYEPMAFNLTTQPILADSGVVAAWPSGIDAEESEDMNVPALYLPAAAVTARYWRIELADTANPDTYVDLGRLVIAGGWQPTNNVRDGLKLGLEDLSTTADTDGGATIPTERPTRRTLIGVLADLAEDEALPNGFDLQRIARTTRQVFVVYDPADTTHLHRRAFLARWRDLSAFELMGVARVAGMPLSLVEEL